MVATDLPPRDSGPPWVTQWQRDVLFALAFAVVGVVGTFGAAHEATSHKDLDAIAITLVIASAACLVVRRRAPLFVLLGTFAAVEIYLLLGYPPGPIYFPYIVAVFGAVLAGYRRETIGALAACFVIFVAIQPMTGWGHRPSLAGVFGVAAWLIAVYAVAEGVRARHERAFDRWRSQQEETRRQASEERLRIARELHDVVAHNISLINVRAGVALHLMDEQPEEARRALAAIKDASKDALDELRSVLDILRQSGEAAPLEPTVGLEHLDDLVKGTQAAGLDVRTEINGSVRSLPPGVDLAAYRIVQEALTNVVRHAGTPRATVRIDYGENDVTVEVIDDGTSAASPPAPSSNGGAGIPGMRERAAALEGHLDAGPRPEGGFVVRARLPVKEPA